MEPKGTKCMTALCKKYVVVVLVVLFRLGALANAAVAINACPPKKCCCSSSPQGINHSMPMDVMDHSGPMGMEVPRTCAPKTSAPCCELKTDPRPIDIAVSPVSNLDHFRIASSYVASDIAIEESEIKICILKSILESRGK